MTTADEPLKHSPLDPSHRALGAKMVPFGGWDMPLAYEAGTIEGTTEATPAPKRAGNGSRTRAKAPAASEAGV